MKGMSFKLRLLLGCLAVAAIPLLICSFVILNIFETTLSRVTLEEGSQQIAQAATQLNELFLSCEAAGEQLAQSTLAVELLQRPDITKTTRLYLELYRSTSGLHKGARVFLYDATGTGLYTTGSFSAEAVLPVNWGILRQATLSDGMVYCDTQNYTGAPQGALMRCARAIRTPEGVVAGYLLIELTEESFYSVLEGLGNSRNDIYISDRFLSLVYSSLATDGEARLVRLRQEYMSTGRLISEPGSNILYHIATEPLSGCHILLEQPTQITAGAMKLMNSINLAAAVGCLLLCLLIAFLLSRSLTRPVQQLNTAMEQVKAGDLSVRVETERGDELGQLTQNFNRMTEELEEYLRSSIQRQQELNDTQIRMLQAQLNPHFLYNTLDTMKWLGKEGGIPEVASLAGSLAVILRRTISAERFVTLGQELAMTQRYINIQKIRFSGRFEYIVEVPDSLMDCTVPKLILQPLIENAIIHGLQDSDSGRVYIYATCQEDALCLSVTDDGCGMDNIMVEQLNSGSYPLSEGHLGLYNVNTIIQMHYGKQYGLRASATRSLGTTVTARIPLERDGGTPAEDKHS
ncbi:MAG: sensor histidine kinase [Angelakisella sp.]